MEKKVDKIIQYTKELRLPGIRKQLQSVLENYSKNKQDYVDFLQQLLEIEHTTRVHNRRLSRVRRARFPFKKYLEQLNVKELPDSAADLLDELSSLAFITEGRNIILAGNPGTGKTHLAIALGIKACEQDYTVLFTTVPRLITQIKESRSEKGLRTLENSFIKYDVVICDEFGYISFDKEGAELLFSHLSLRAGLKSTIITTNLSFDRWNEIFGDTILTAAMVDRLTHKAHIVNMNGASYRAKETQKLV